MKSLLPPLGDRSLHFEDAEVMAAMVGSEHLIDNVRNRLMFMTTGEKWSLYRAIVKLSKEISEPVESLPLVEAKEKERCEHGVWLADRCYQCVYETERPVAEPKPTPSTPDEPSREEIMNRAK
jgi:hypothetical protein